MSRLEDIIDSIYELTGMDIAILDSRKRIVIRRYTESRICAYIHKSHKCFERCLFSDKDRLYEARDKMICYKCPFGVYEIISPLRIEGGFSGYLFLSFGIEKGEEAKRQVISKVKGLYPALNVEALKKAIDESRRYSKEEIGAYATLVPIVVDFIESNNIFSEGRSIGELTKHYIRENLSKKITLKEISLNLHYSTVTLTEHFKEEFGMTIMEYVMQKRMKKARQMLENGEYSVGDVGKACGFPEAGYFTRCYKNYYGENPKLHRKKK